MVFKYTFLIQIFIVAGLLFVGCGQDDFIKDDKDEQCNNSEFQGYQTIELGTSQREYILYLPTSYNEDNPTPLIINFHGFGGCVSEFISNTGISDSGLNVEADLNNFIVAYPQGITRQKGAPEWDPGNNGSQNINENDIYFVEQLIADIDAAHNIDLNRIYATGYSNGGMMAYGLACQLSNRIAAVGIMSGVMLPDDCNIDESTSIIHFHGISDDVLPVQGNQEYQSIPSIVEFWLDHNQIPSTNLVTTSLNNGDVLLDEYAEGNANTVFNLYTVNREFDKSGGHVWFTGNINGKSPNQILWEFLIQFSLED